MNIKYRFILDNADLQKFAPVFVTKDNISITFPFQFIYRELKEESVLSLTNPDWKLMKKIPLVVKDLSDLTEDSLLVIKVYTRVSVLSSYWNLLPMIWKLSIGLYLKCDVNGILENLRFFFMSIFRLTIFQT